MGSRESLYSRIRELVFIGDRDYSVQDDVWGFMVQTKLREPLTLTCAASSITLLSGKYFDLFGD